MNFKTSFAAVALGAASSLASATTPTIHTFGTGDIYFAGSSYDVYRSSLVDMSRFGERHIKATMKVSDTGDVVYATTVSGSAISNDISWGFNVWRASSNTDQVLHDSPALYLGITRDGNRVLAGNLYEADEEGYKQIYGGSMTLSSDGRLVSGVAYGGGSNGNTIADYPTYTLLDRYAVSFEKPDDYTPLFDGGILEQHSKGFYEEVHIIDADGNADTLLTLTLNGWSTPQEEWTEGSGGAYADLYNVDFTLMDKQGRYISHPYNVDYVVSLSENGQSVLAYEHRQTCSSINNIFPNRCAIIWNADGDVQALGNFNPFAMSGDASFVVGRSHGDDNTAIETIVWDAENGIRTFDEFASSIGLDVTEWSDVYLTDVSADGSKIVGHGINTNGIREGIMIDMPTKASEKWGYVDLDQANTDLFVSSGWTEETGLEQVIGDTISTSSTQGEKITYKFNGSRIKVYGTKGLNNGYIKVYVDDVLMGNVDTFSCSEDFTDVLFESRYLGEGEHIIDIEVFETHNLASGGTQIGIDGFEVESYTQAPQEATNEEGDVVGTPVWALFDYYFDMYNQVPEHPEQCSNTGWGMLCGVTQEWTWSFYDRHAMSSPLSEVLSADGSFSVEVWFRHQPSRASGLGNSQANDYHSNLLNLAAFNKQFGLDLYDHELRWTGKDDTSVVSVNSHTFQWNHVVLTGNWNAGLVSIYLNGTLIGSANTADYADANKDIVVVGRELDDSGYYALTGHVPKLAGYDEEFDASQVIDLFDWPTRYGLPFAPNVSPEYTTRLPGCAFGCEPGLEVDGLPMLHGLAGTGLGGAGTGTGTGGTGTGGL